MKTNQLWPYRAGTLQCSRQFFGLCPQYGPGVKDVVYFYAMIAFANCKINLGLFVTGKRPDGYHDIESVFYPINWTDAVEVELYGSANKCELVEYGKAVGGDPASNLCYKAYHLLDQRFSLPPVRIHLFKTLPMGAGLGGGSSNGSATLKLLNRFFGLGLTLQELMQMAAQLGSDCPFFITNQPALVKGRGEILSPIALDLSDFYFLVVHPGVHMSTAEAYNLVLPKSTDTDLQVRMTGEGPENWKNFLRNDFEEPVFSKFPLIRAIKEKMYAQGATFALMSGSGSAVYGLFEKYDEVKKAQEIFAHYTTKLIYPEHYLAGFAV